MAGEVTVGFGPVAAPPQGVLVVFTDEGLRVGEATRRALGAARDQLVRAARSERFTGKAGSTLDIVAPAGLKASRLVFVGIGKDELKSRDLVKLGGTAMGRIPAAAT